MLRELHITNLAVIEDAAIEFTEGLNVFTGQTGAGKSLVIGAFELLLGLRSASGAAEMIRAGADEARITGVFDPRPRHMEAEKLKEIERLCDQRLEPGEPLIITRKLLATGRSSVSINGQPATAAMARAIGEQLVDIHGQHDHQFLLRPANQLLLLDAVAGCDELREQFGERYGELRRLRQLQRELSTSTELRRQQLELYEFQAGEIDAVEPTEGEFTELHARHKVLTNLARLKQDAGAAHAALYETDGSVNDRLQAIAHHLIDLAEVDESLSPVAEQVRTATMALQDASYELGRYVDRLDLDPQEAVEVEQRLNALNRLIAKYGERKPSDDPLASVLEFRGKIGEQIEQLRGQAADASQIEQQITRAELELRTIGDKLTAARKKAAARLCPKVEAELKELGMAEARFEVAIEPAEPGPSGADGVEWLAQTNPGQGFRPLRKIASGGELSRIMLAIKSIVAGADRISVLVFDEIDANIGGRLGSVIGQKLRGLAHDAIPGEATTLPGGAGLKKSTRAEEPSTTRKGGGPRNPRNGHQVLCITHLPQIAAFADRHFRIAKTVTGKGKTKQTRTDVTVLDGQPRIEELAEMMAGQKITEASRKQAAELVAAAVG